MSSLGNSGRTQATSPLTLRLVGLQQELQNTADQEQSRQSRFQAWQVRWAETREKLQQRLGKIDAQLARMMGHERTSPQLKIVLDEDLVEP